MLGTPVWVYEWGQPIVHPDDPQFAPVRAELGRLFLQHKHDLALKDWTDQQVVERVNDIAAALIGCGQVALQRGDRQWLERHRWFGEACERLFRDQQAMPLDG